MRLSPSLAPRNAMLTGVLLFPAVAAGGISDCTPGWVPTFGEYPGTPDTILALATYDAGNGPALFVGGEFNTAGAASGAQRVACWDGATWESLGETGSAERVRALAVFDAGGGPEVYVSGLFPNATLTTLASWNGHDWTPRGNPGWYASALAVFDDGTGPRLYAGVPGGLSCWDGAGPWTTVGGGVAGSVTALTVHDDGTGPALYVGGSFQTAGGVHSPNVARWDGTSWSALGEGTSGIVYALASYDDGTGPALAVGGHFSAVSSTPMANVALWKDGAWSSLGGGTDQSVRALRAWDDGSGPALFVGGTFTSVDGGLAANGFARWSSGGWSTVPGAPTGSVFALEVSDLGGGEELYVAGDSSGTGIRRIASWNGTEWSSLGRGGCPDAQIISAVVHEAPTGPELWIGGGPALGSVGGQTTGGTARWDGESWFAGGLDPQFETVWSMLSYDDGSGPVLHAAVDSVHRYDGSAWTSLGGGPGMRFLAAHDDGNGTALHAATLGTVLRLDGSSWTALGSTGGSGQLKALASYDDGTGARLYAGGGFTAMGGTPASRVASWDGTSWADVGGGIDDVVHALAAFDDGTGSALYAGGYFSTAGGVAANGIARWDGTSWSAAGDVPCSVLAVFDAGSGPALFSNGTAPGSPTKVCRWTGTAWVAVSGGPRDGTIQTLAGGDLGDTPSLFVGGSFHETVDSRDSFLARWRSCVDPARFCFGSVPDCPCGNVGLPGHGCNNAQETGGIELALVAQTTAPAGATVTGTGFSTMGAPTALVIRSSGLEPSPVVFGDGLRCVSSTALVRLAATTASGGTSTHAFGHGAMVGNGDFYYQIWYRNTPSAYCTPAAFNLSSGLRISWP